MASVGKFACDGCGKTYSWKPDLAGRRVKCKCTNVMTVPAEDPAAAEALPEGFEDLYALAEGAPVTAEAVTPPPIARGNPCPSCGKGVAADAVLCVNCGHHLKTGKKVKTKAAKAAGGGGGGGPVLAGAGAGGGGAALGYASMAPRRRGDENSGGGDVFIHPVNDLYIPAGLIVLGTVFSYIVTVYYYGVHSPGIAMLAVALLTIINVVLVVPAILMTVKLFDLGLGPIGPGILKMAACAIVPGALGELIGKVMIGGGGGGYIGWTISYLTTIGLFMKLLEMDFFEMVVCSMIIFVIRTFLVTTILIALLGGMGVGGLPSGAMGMGGGGGGRITLSGQIDRDEDDSLDQIRAKQSDADVSGMLQSGGVEGKEWIDGSPARALAGQSHEKSVRLINGFRDAGALHLRIYPRKNVKGAEVANVIIVVPPVPGEAASKEGRIRVLKELKVLAKELGRTTPRDRGERFWPIHMLTDEEADKEFNVPYVPGKTVPGTSPDDNKDEDDN